MESVECLDTSRYCASVVCQLDFKIMYYFLGHCNSLMKEILF